MQSVDLSVWCAKQALLHQGVLASAALREPATLPDAVMRHEFETFLQQMDAGAALPAGGMCSDAD